MGDGLSAFGSGIDDGAIALVEMMLGGQLFGDDMDMAQNGGVCFFGLGERRNMPARHDQQMHGSFWINVGEGVDLIVFVDFFRRDASGDDFAEKTIHAVRISHAPAKERLQGCPLK